VHIIIIHVLSIIVHSVMFTNRYVGKLSDENYGEDNDTSPVWLNQVRCYGYYNIKSIVDCPHSDFGTCSHRKRLSVSCIPYSSSGKLSTNLISFAF